MRRNEEKREGALEMRVVSKELVVGRADEQHKSAVTAGGPGDEPAENNK